MNREEVQLLDFEIVAFARDARSKFLEALTAAQAGGSTKAGALTEEGNNCIAGAHKAQTSLLTKEAQGNDIAYSIAMMHSQDYLMVMILLKDLIKHLLESYKEG